MIGLFRYRDSLYYFRSKIIIAIIISGPFCVIISYAQDATVTVNVKTPDGTGHPNIEVHLDNQTIPLHYQELTDTQGQAILNDVLTPVEAEQDNTYVKDYRLSNGFPNPAGETGSLFKFNYTIPTEINGSTQVNVRIFDLQGKLVKTLASEDQTPGKYEATWDGKTERGYQTASGIYFYQIQTKDALITKKMILLGNIGGSITSDMVRKIGETTSSQTRKQGSIDYNLSTNDDAQGRFDNILQPETITGDTTIDLTAQERFAWQGPQLIVMGPGDTTGVAYDWAQFGTALQDLLNNGTDYVVVGSDQDSIYLTPTDPQTTGNLPIELLAKAIYGTNKDVSQPVNIIPAAGDSVYGIVTTPNGIKLENVDVAAYDNQFNLFNRDITDGNGRYSIDSLTTGIINLIFTDLNNNRTEKDTVLNVTLPTQLDKTQQEIFQYNGPSEINGQEQDTIWVDTNDYNYPGFGLGSLELENEETWDLTAIIGNLKGYTTDNPNLNGTIPLILKATANGGTQRIQSTPVNLQDMVNISGGIYDNDFYLKLVDGSTGPPIAGYVKESATGQKIYTTDGLFTIRIPATSNVTLKAQHIVGEDTLSYEPSFDFDASQDISDIILHPVTSYGMEPGQMPLFKMFYYLVNDRTGHFNYSGKKYMDKNPSTHRVVIPLINDLGDTMTVADQDSVENYLLSTYFNGMQNPPPIFKLDATQPTPIGDGGGQWIIFMRNDGPNSGAAVDFNEDGIIDEAYIKLSKAGGPSFYWGTVASEMLTGEVGVNNLNDSRLTDKTVLDGSSVTLNGPLYVFDHKLRHLGENYPPLELLEKILGNVTMIDP